MKFYPALLISLTVALGGCTSLGHEARAVPSIAKPIAEKPQKVIVIDDGGSLAGYFQRFLDSEGIIVLDGSAVTVEEKADNRTSTYKATDADYTIRVTSTDLDICVPEGTRQMHFNVRVTDNRTQQRVYSSAGEFGCAGTITKTFASWILGR